MKNLKGLSVWVLTAAILLAPVGQYTAFAAPSLDDITATTEAPTNAPSDVETQVDKEIEKGESNKSSNKSGSSDFVNGLKSAADLGEPSEEAAKVGGTIAKIGRIVFQIAGYVISVGIGCMIAIDLIFITIAPSRSLLANGYVGNPQAANPQAQQNGMMGGMGSPGMGGFGGGMGGGYGGGMGRFGGMGGGMGMGGMGMGQQAGMNAAQQNQPANGRIQWVSNAALNAVATESTGMSAFKTYIKQELPMCILAPLILFLAKSGILASLGFALGNMIQNGLANMMSSF